MRSIRRILLSALLLTCVAGMASAQAGAPLNDPPPVEPLNLSGPRAGVTHLSPGIREAILDYSGDAVGPLITQFGWQWESRLFSSDGGFTGVSEWVVLVGGLEQSLFLPSVSWVMGIRSGTGVELGVGPNVTPAGTALAIAGGMTLRSGPIFFPVNLAMVPSKSGLRVSLLTGFNTRRGNRSDQPAVNAPL